jgi:Tol biopolymer transport system component
MPFAPGTRFGPYEIAGALGAGGMGEVYLARDPRLGREVAIKILPAHLISDADAVARFEQEARAVAALSHPNIVAIHDVGRDVAGDRTIVYAVMERLEGRTLRDVMASGALPLRKSVDYALQTAQGLAAAHAKGITHRDLKPENLFVTADGHVKILDFGLAKLGPVAAADTSGETTSMQVAKTDPGAVMGTVGYLSPEQAQARPIDQRSDIFSFGAVLYEMTTGRRAFQRSTSIDTLHSIVHDELPPIETVRADVPNELSWVVSKCLAKEPDERYQSTRDLVVDLKKVVRAIESSPSLPRIATQRLAVAPPQQRRRLGIIVVGAALVFVAAAVWWMRGRERTASAGPAAVTVERVTMLGTVIAAAISPDGKYAAYITSENARQALWIRQLATASTLQLLPPAVVGFWGLTFSPDGSAVYYAKEDAEEPQRAIYSIPALGGVPRKVVSGTSSPPTFSPDGRSIAYIRESYPDSSSSAVMVAGIDGSNPRPLAVRHAPDFFAPIFFTAAAWSPDGSTIVAPVERRDGPLTAGLAALRSSDGAAAPFPSYSWEGAGQAAWLPDGSGLIVVRREQQSGSHQLWWVSSRASEQHRITNDLQDYRSASLTADGASVLAVAAEASGAIWTMPVDELGEPRRISQGKYDGLSGLSTAPDGRILFRSIESGTPSIWAMSADGSHRTQITTQTAASWPAALPDGRSIVFVKSDSGALQSIGVDGQQEHALGGPTSAAAPVVSPDGNWILFESTSTGQSRIWKMPAAGGRAMPLIGGISGRPAWSPDGRHVAFYYQADQSKLFSIAIMPIDGRAPSATFPVIPSTAYSFVRWTADGRALLHNSAMNDRANVWLQPIAGGPPRQMTHFLDQVIFGFDISRDGKTLVISRGLLSRDALLLHNFK